MQLPGEGPVHPDTGARGRRFVGGHCIHQDRGAGFHGSSYPVWISGDVGCFSGRASTDKKDGLPPVVSWYSKIKVYNFNRFI